MLSTVGFAMLMCMSVLSLVAIWQLESATEMRTPLVYTALMFTSENLGLRLGLGARVSREYLKGNT